MVKKPKSVTTDMWNADADRPQDVEYGKRRMVLDGLKVLVDATDADLRSKFPDVEVDTRGPVMEWDQEPSPHLHHRERIHIITPEPKSERLTQWKEALGKMETLASEAQLDLLQKGAASLSDSGYEPKESAIAVARRRGVEDRRKSPVRPRPESLDI